MTRLEALLAELGLGWPAERASITGADPVLPCAYPLGESAAAVMAAVGLGAARLGETRGDPVLSVSVDVRHAAAHLRGFLDQVLDGEVLDPDPTGHLPGVGLFATRDGRWVQTYGAFAPLDARMASVLGLPEGFARADAAAAVARWDAEPLVEALVAAGTPGAVAMSAAEWDAGAQGAALRSLPPVVLEPLAPSPPEPFPREIVPPRAPTTLHEAARLPEGPLRGLRVVDLSRILAGPVCSRTLAELGADVVQVVDPALHEVGRVARDTAAGKRGVELSLGDQAGIGRVRELIAGADVVVQNARPGSLERKGLGAGAAAELRPGVVYVSIDAYGHAGPWAQRPGFEPVAQASTGWALDHADADGTPQIVPALPCDYLTGFLGALGVVAALERRRHGGGAFHVRASLARTAVWLRDQPGRVDVAAATGIDARSTRDLRHRVGDAEPLRPAIRLR